MAAGGFGVSPPRLIAHGAEIERLSGGAGTAADAATSVQLDSQAYGMLCQALPLLLNPLSSEIGGAIQGLAQSLTTTGANLRTTARNYESADEDAAAALHWLKGF